MKRCLYKAQFVAIAFVLAGCGGDDSSSGGGGGGGSGNVLVKSSASPADAQCAGGGTKLELGSDKNGNGTLDADEVTATQTVCSQSPTLTTVTPSGPSGKCKNGGTTVKSGPDANGNGKLDDNEVKDTQEICDGGSSTMLATTTVLGNGDINCPFGGVKTESGLDNGTNGGTPGDGVLSTGEVTSTTYACTTAPGGKSLAPPSGPAGTSKILATGGVGSVNGGGNGSNIQLGISIPSFGGNGTNGNVKIWKNGTLDASFTMAAQTPVFGATKMEVAANKTIATYANNASGQVDGEYYTINNNGLFFRQNAGNPQVTVTGVHVAAGVTLTFPMNGINFSTNDDFHNEGTVTSALNGVNRGNIQMTVAKYIGAAGSKVTLNGGNGTGAGGGAGGTFALFADLISNAGDIDTSGGNGDAAGSFNGGSAGQVSLQATRVFGQSGPTQNTGTVKAVGGTGKANGGSGNQVVMFSWSKGVYNKGTVDTSGGGGGTGGGNASPVVFQSFFGGSIYTGGTLTSKGGDVDEAVCPATCSGGLGNQVIFQAFGGDIVSASPVTTTGGKSKGVAGGSGGLIQFLTTDHSDPVLGTPRPAGSIRLTGTMDARGGAGASGGPANAIRLGISTGQAVGQEFEMFGYDTIDASGGNGVTGAGSGSTIQIYNQISPNALPSGSVIVHANVSSKGGAASTSGVGGSGGPVQIWAGNGNLTGGPSLKGSTALIGGNVDTSAGAGVSGGGQSGPIDIRGREQVDVFGTITGNGGNTTANGAPGGFAQNVSLLTSGPLNLNGAIAVKGGNASGTATAGGGTSNFQFWGGTVKATGNISLTGGNGNGANGGNSGQIDIRGSQAPSTLGSVTSTGGTGTPAGVNGPIFIDGNQVQ